MQVVTSAPAGNTWWDGYVEVPDVIGELLVDKDAVDKVPEGLTLDDRFSALLRAGSGEQRLFLKDAGQWQGYCELTPSVRGEFPSRALTIISGDRTDKLLRGRVDNPDKVAGQSAINIASGGAIVVTEVAATCDVVCVQVGRDGGDRQELTVPSAAVQALLSAEVARVEAPTVGHFPSTAVEAVPAAPTHVSLSHPTHAPECTKLTAKWAIGDVRRAKRLLQFCVYTCTTASADACVCLRLCVCSFPLSRRALKAQTLRSFSCGCTALLSRAESWFRLPWKLLQVLPESTVSETCTAPLSTPSSSAQRTKSDGGPGALTLLSCPRPRRSLAQTNPDPRVDARATTA